MNGRGTDIERDALVARFTDFYLEEYEAESNLRVAASLFARDETRKNLDRLKQASREFRAVRDRIETLSGGQIELGIRGDAHLLADRIRSERFDKRYSRYPPAPVPGATS